MKYNNWDITVANCLHLLLTEEGVEEWIHPSRTCRFVLMKYCLHLTCRSGPKLLVKHEPGFFVYPHPATYAVLFCISFRTYSSIFKLLNEMFHQRFYIIFNEIVNYTFYITSSLVKVSGRHKGICINPSISTSLTNFSNAISLLGKSPLCKE